jgi:hypothetical protein
MPIVVRIGEHIIRIKTKPQWVREYISAKYHVLSLAEDQGVKPDIELTIQDGFGVPFENFDVKAAEREDGIRFSRSDYEITAARDFRTATVSVYDDFALKHAMMNLYSSFIVHFEWGLLVHSSCIIEKGKAYLFAGHSGAGKSTVAAMSLPRPILSDEAAILKVEPEGVTVFDSPFRSGIELKYPGEHCQLAAVQFLRQSPDIRRVPLAKAEAMTQMFSKAFYWPHSPADTIKIMGLFKHLIQRIPFYDLYFQKNDAFWKEIS